jgi:hypothetical protein
MGLIFEFEGRVLFVYPESPCREKRFLKRTLKVINIDCWIDIVFENVLNHGGGLGKLVLCVSPFKAAESVKEGLFVPISISSGLTHSL